MVCITYRFYIFLHIWANNAAKLVFKGDLWDKGQRKNDDMRQFTCYIHL